MGQFFSSLLKKLTKGKEMRVLMVGLDGAGKTTILNRLAFGDTVSTLPTIGFNVETIQYAGIQFNVWDVGGQDKLRALWRHYYTGTNALIFVVDTNDRDRFETCAEEMGRIIADPELQGVTLLVLANKTDLPNSLKDGDELAKRLRVTEWAEKGIGEHKIQNCCAVEGKGIFEGLRWLAERVGGVTIEEGEET